MERIRRKKRRITVKSAKDKGRNLQKKACEYVSKLFDNEPWGYEDECLIQPRVGSQKGTDVVLRGYVKEEFPAAIECKSAENIGWQSAMRQAKNNTKKGEFWLVFLKTKKIKTPVVVLDADVFFELISKKINKD